MILAPHAISFEVACPFEIEHDPLYGPFGNADLHRDVSDAEVGPVSDAIEDVRMVAQKRPFMRL